MRLQGGKRFFFRDYKEEEEESFLPIVLCWLQLRLPP